MRKVQDAWFSLMADLKVDSGRARPAFQLLKRLYTEKHRKYHTLQHIAQGLDELALVVPLLEDAPCTLYAWMLHDAVQDTKYYKLNEIRSADTALGLSSALGLSQEFGIDAVRRILPTASHTESEQPENMDIAFLLDVDMSILGQPEKVFAEYDQKIRAEYGFLSAEQFVKHRRSFVRKVLKRDRLYHTDFFFARYEEQARENLKSLLKQ